MKPTRRTQPYRRSARRRAGRALAAMLKGRTAGGRNPADLRRQRVKRARRRVPSPYRR